MGRIFAVTADHRQHPFLSANDRSRWATIRALVDHGTYEIDQVIVDRRWDSIDKVRHIGRDGKQHYYSSKPPLYPTILAGQYWLIKHGLGVEISQHPFYVARVILVLTHGLLLLLLFWVLWQIVRRYSETPWGAIFVFASGTLATFLTTFSVTLNNHLPGATFAALAFYCGLRIWIDDRVELRYFFLAGFAGAFCAANELPALSLFGLLGLALLIRHPTQTLLAGVPGAIVVGIAFFATNYIAHDSLRPPYMHRGDGRMIGELNPQQASVLDSGTLPPELFDLIEARENFNLSDEARIEVVTPEQRWILHGPGPDRRWPIQQTASRIELRGWDNWYDYETSYWQSGVKVGVDLGESSKAWYAFHILVGHHGIFSLTPIWIFVPLGLAIWINHGTIRWKQLAMFIALLSLLCLLFYIFRPLKDRNYGGVTSGFRWVFWLAPLWLTAMLPAVDWIGKTKLGQGIAYLALLASIVSASYSGLNPWQHPWIYSYLQYLNLID
ncbi:MAG: hypothetical protein WD045_08050 [Pirellulaceae bacterium]